MNIKVIKDMIIGSWLKREFDGNWENHLKPRVSPYAPDWTKEKIKTLVDKPDYQNDKQNDFRLMLLSFFRYPLLIPCWHADWVEKDLDEDIFKNLYVIKDPGWNVLSNSSGKIANVAKTLLDKKQEAILSTRANIDNNFRLLLRAINEMVNAETLDKFLVLLESEDSECTTILEGNKTAVALYIKCYKKKEMEYQPFKVYVGRLKTKSIWQW